MTIVCDTFYSLPPGGNRDAAKGGNSHSDSCLLTQAQLESDGQLAASPFRFPVLDLDLLRLVLIRFAVFEV